MFEFFKKLFGKLSDNADNSGGKKGKSSKNLSTDQQLALLKKIISPYREGSLPVDISRVEKIIKESIPETLESNAPNNFPEMYFELEYVFDKFYDFILFRELIGKNVIALGGGFSSGKSSFLNDMLGGDTILPTAVSPSTSVPAYVIQDQKERASAVNTFAAKTDMKFTDIRFIAHGFGKGKDEEITLGHLLRSIFVATPKQPYENIAFLDTPGYSKPDSADYSAKTDEKIAHSQLNSSNYILWFISADAGTIRADDIEFLLKLDERIPKLIIINKIDKIPDKKILPELKAEIKLALDLKGIKYLDVLTYTKNKNVECDREDIKSFLQKLNNGKAEYDFAYEFKKLFVACKEYYEKKLESAKNNLSQLNRMQTISDISDINDSLFSLSVKIKADITELKECSSKLQHIQQDFFTELKLVADSVGINMPEPSELDVLDDKMVDPLKLIDNL